MRLLRLLIALACLAAGVAIGGLNTDPVRVDLGIVQLSTTLGVAVIVSVLVGVVVGGVALAASRLRPREPRGGPRGGRPG